MGDGSLEKMFEMDVSGERLGREKDRGGGEKKLLSERIFFFALAYRGAALSGVARRNGLWPGSVRP